MANHPLLERNSPHPPITLPLMSANDSRSLKCSNYECERRVSLCDVMFGFDYCSARCAVAMNRPNIAAPTFQHEEIRSGLWNSASTGNVPLPPHSPTSDGADPFCKGGYDVETDHV